MYLLCELSRRFLADHPHDARGVFPGMTAETDDVGNYNALGGA
jgi:hypothetical protein